MRKFLWILLLVIAPIIFTAYVVFKINTFYTLDKIELNINEPIIAFLDTSKTLALCTHDSAIHYIINWVNNEESYLPKATIAALVNKKNPLFFDLDIWSRKMISNFDNPVDIAITEGNFDVKLVAFFKILSGGKNTVYLRYNPLMELPSTKFPWQNQNCNKYINSFRHIAVLCKKYCANVKIVWGCDGYPGMEEYWPGTEFVDISTVNIDTNSPVKKNAFGPYTSIEEMIRLKLFRMRFMNIPVLLLGSPSILSTPVKPVWIANLNSKFQADKAIYNTPVIPINTSNNRIKKLRDKALMLGVYDPLLKLTPQPFVTAEHIFTDIKSVKNGDLKIHLNEVIARHHDIILTIEPWRDIGIERDSAILLHTLNGMYDNVWRMLFKQIVDLPQIVYLRWSHEMEIPVDRYPWQKQDPVTYIKAFRYFAGFKPAKNNNIKIVWGPAGDRGSVEWWPGEDVVDFVSIAIYGLPDKNINDYNKQASFASIFQNKFHRLRFVHKPIFITEFGVKGPEEYKKQWLIQAASIINSYPEIKGICYFNFSDTPKAWGSATTPDWSISTATFKSFTNRLTDLPK